MVHLYGIANCQTVRKARAWLDARSIGYHFHDLRADGVNASQIRDWASALGWEALLNRRSTTWRQLPHEQRANLDADRAIALLCEHPTLIRRPLLEFDGNHEVGFSPERYQELLA